MQPLEATNDYERYEQLILEKDRLEKEADGWFAAYLREFGPLTAEVFALKIDCIPLKKEISLYIAANNAGIRPNAEEISKVLQGQMAAYQAELAEMQQNNRIAAEMGKGRALTLTEQSKVKTIYRRLAKLLHPDISPLAREYEEFADLFEEVIDAYKRNNLKKLESLEVLFHKRLEELGIDSFDMQIDNLDERIAALEEDIAAITTTEPFTYGAFLQDAEAVEQKQQALEKEKADYTAYKVQLQTELERIQRDMGVV